MKCNCTQRGSSNASSIDTLCELHAIEVRRRLREALEPVMQAGEKLEIAVIGIATTDAEKAVAKNAVEGWLRARKNAREMAER